MDQKYRAVTFLSVLALVALVLHFAFGWHAFVDEASSHNEKALWGDYLIVWMRDVWENIQSEFIQLAVQLAILAGLFRGVAAYEEDQEEIKRRLDRLEKS